MRKPVSIMVRTLDSDGRWIDHEVKYEDGLDVRNYVVFALGGFPDLLDVRVAAEGSEDEDLLSVMGESVPRDMTTGWWSFVIGEDEDRLHALVWEIWN